MRLKNILDLNKRLRSDFGKLASKKCMARLFNAEFSTSNELFDCGFKVQRTDDLIEFVRTNCPDSNVADFLTNSFLFAALRQSLKSDKEITPSLIGKCKILSSILSSLQNRSDKMTKREKDIIIYKAMYADRLAAAQKSGYKRLLDCAIAEIDLKNILLAFRISKIGVKKEFFFSEFLLGGTLSRDFLIGVFDGVLGGEALLKLFPSRFRMAVKSLFSGRFSSESEKLLCSIMTKNTAWFFPMDWFVSLVWVKLCEYRLADEMTQKLNSSKAKDRFLTDLNFADGSGFSKIAVISDNDGALAFKLAGADVFKSDSETEAEKLIFSLIEKSYNLVFVSKNLIGSFGRRKKESGFALDCQVVELLV